MSTRYIGTLAKLASLPPLRINQALGACLGWITWASKTSPRKITEANLEICFPNMPVDERTELAKRSLIETGKQILECAWLWNRPRAQLIPLMRTVEGQDLLDDARASDKGLIMVTPHMGNWEFCPLPLSLNHPFTYFYRSPRKKSLEAQLLRWRANVGGEPATLDVAGIRQGMKILKQGGTLGILPDQEPDLNNGVFAPFFNEPALTMTLLNKLAVKTRATVLFCVAKRRPRGAGWDLHYLSADDMIADRDPVVAAAALNRTVERCIGLCTEQYLWDYKRFKTLEDGTPRNYQ